jgi:hypothetical protein
MTLETKLQLQSVQKLLENVVNSYGYSLQRKCHKRDILICHNYYIKKFVLGMI